MIYPTRAKVFPGLQGGSLVIFFHGLFGGSIDPLCSPEIHRLAERLIQDNICAVGLYETSRNLMRDDRDFIAWAKEAFAGKTFADEVHDVEIALKELTNAFSEYKRLIFVGFSLGGTLSTYFLDTYHPDAVLMFGSGCATRSKHMPIGSTYPPKSEILDNLKNYRGTLKIFQGTEDAVVPKGGAKQILRAATKAARRDFVQLGGVDHRFQMRYGTPDATLKDFLFKEVVLAVEEIDDRIQKKQ